MYTLSACPLLGGLSSFGVSFIRGFTVYAQESFLSVPMWLEHINERASAASKLLVGSKYDLGSERVVDSFRAKVILLCS